MNLPNPSVFLIKIANDLADRDSVRPLQGVVTCFYLSAQESWCEKAQALIQQHASHFSYFLFLGPGENFDLISLQKGISACDGDEMRGGFQYAWDRMKNSHLLPFLLNGAFCLKQKIVIDFGVDFGVESAILQTSYQANRCGYRFDGLPPPAEKLLPIVSEIKTTDIDIAHILLNYLNSQDRKWALFESQFDLNHFRILLDLRHFAPSFNGTNTCGMNIMKQLYKEIDPSRVRILCLPATKEYLKFSELFPGWETVELLNEVSEREIHFVLGQPWSEHDIYWINSNAYAVYFLILDTIAWDCLYMRKGYADLDRLWKYWARRANGFIFISEFTKKVFLDRFPAARQVNQHVALLSTTAQDYVHPSTSASVAQNDYYLIFGNFYDHKFIQPTLNHIEPLLSTGEKIYVVGAYEGKSDEKIVHFKSGSLSDEEIAALYQNAKAVLYPSQFEGFGLPIAEALAYGKTVFARGTSLLQELIGHWEGPGMVIPFAHNLDLVEKFKLFQTGKLDVISVKPKPQAPINDWVYIGKSIFKFLMTTTAKESTHAKVEERFRDYDLARALVPK